MTLTGILASHREKTIQTLTQTLTTTPSTHDELLQNLERIWQLAPGRHTDNDRIWLDAASALTPELRETLRNDAYDKALYAAARCLTYLSA